MWKEAWPGMTESEYTYLMETNEDHGDVSAFLEFSAAMDRATNDWELVQVAKQWMKAKMVRHSRATAREPISDPRLSALPAHHRSDHCAWG